MSSIDLRVRLRENSQYANTLENIIHGDLSCNPIGVTGTIIAFDSEDEELYLRVKWDNGYNNWYSHKDLRNAVTGEY